MKRKNNKKQYVEIKKYTPIRGILLCIVAQIVMMIPILNMIILADTIKDEPCREPWNGCLYDKEKVYVKEEDIKNE